MRVFVTGVGGQLGHDVMNELISIFIPPENATPEELEEAKRNMAKYSDYRTYLSFDMQQIVANEDGSVMKLSLSKMLRKNSGGEGQKIAIARALYKDAPFLILDEPTAALDPIAEAEIYEKLNDMVGDKTAIYISHRLSSCKFCDEIVVFDAGKIIQQGAHEALLADESGEYAQLWNAQAQYYR